MASDTILVGNTTKDLHPSTFILLGIPGLEYAHIWISIPFCLMYIMAIGGNIVLLFIIKTEESLHTPMYFFLCMLAGTDLVLINTTVPKALGIFWLNAREIYMNACLLQMYIAHSFSSLESGVLTLMALDRYIAICHPLRYASILTNQWVTTLGLLYLLKSALYFFPYPFLVKRLIFCKDHIIGNTYCEHMSVEKLACSDISINIIYGLTVILLTGAQDMSFITFSYFMILRAVSRLSTNAERWKTLSTCMSHICVMAVFYAPVLSTVFIQRFTQDVIPYLHIIVANVYYIAPPIVNPLVYAFRTPQIRGRVINMLSFSRVPFCRFFC